MRVVSIQPKIFSFEPPHRSSFFREVFIQPFERLGFEKSFVLISDSFMTFFLGCLTGSNKK